jgi:hypothetical protein
MEDKCLSVSFVSELSSKDLLLSFRTFCHEGATEFNKVPFFTGFFLINSDFTEPLFDGVKNLLCNLSPVFIHLAQSASDTKPASWLCSGSSSVTSDLCYPVPVQTKSPGWVVHRNLSQALCTSNGQFDIFFSDGKLSAMRVNPDLLSEERVSQYYGVLKDAQLNVDSVPHCNTIMKDLTPSLFSELFPQLVSTHSNPLNIVERDVIWSAIDTTSREFVHVLPVLNRQQYRQCSTYQKCVYVKRIAWIVSRSLLVPGSKKQFNDRYFAVRTTGCFMLHQKDSVVVKSNAIYERFRKFYLGGDDLLLPDLSLFTDSIAKLQRDNPYAIIPKQVWTEKDLNGERSQMNIFPTLEFHKNSCWLESSIAVLFSLEQARLRILSSNHEMATLFRSLFNVMLVYGLGNPPPYFLVPTVECMRCGMYPVEAKSPPPILGSEGYSNIFGEGLEWGTTGCIAETLNRFFSFLDIQPYHMRYGEHQNESVYCNSDVLCVSYNVDVRVIQQTYFGVYGVTAVVFSNTEHFFTLCKAATTPDWTVKDALVGECSTHLSLIEAMKKARNLHPPNQRYRVYLAVYAK